MLVNVESLAFPEGGIGSDMRIATNMCAILIMKSLMKARVG